MDYAASPSNWPHMHVWGACIWLRQSNFPAARAWVRDSGRQPSDGLTFQYEMEYGILARVLIAENRVDETIALLCRLQAGAATTGCMSRAFKRRTILALAHYVSGALDGATAALTRSIELA